MNPRSADQTRARSKMRRTVYRSMRNDCHHSPGSSRVNPRPMVTYSGDEARSVTNSMYHCNDSVSQLVTGVSLD